VQVVDEFTGRVMPDRSWSQGLHQILEVKEGCEVTRVNETLARISYQRFFRRYLRLSGMTGTAREVRDELGAVYHLPVVRIPTHRPGRRVHHPDRVFATNAAKWQAIAERVVELHGRGIPVLIGTRSVSASELGRNLLEQKGLEVMVLNAKQDASEAEIVSRAGEPGRITIATNMAGRGTDIVLDPHVRELGGLYVILTERHEAARIDRQLAGRSARQGDPGGFEAFLSLEDSVLDHASNHPTGRLLRKLASLDGKAGHWALKSLITFAQQSAEREHTRIRRQLLKSDRFTGQSLSFTGRAE
jgi:preprotein translocase subunit SecA